MLIKIIKCIVDNELKSDFQNAQSKWSELSAMPGFISQFGGWNKLHFLEAVIVGVWQSPEHYHFFMKEIHDQIIGKNRQEGLYQSIEISLWHTPEGLSQHDFEAIEYFEIYKSNENDSDHSLTKNLILLIDDKKMKFMSERSADRVEAQVELIKEWTIESN